MRSIEFALLVLFLVLVSSGFTLSRDASDTTICDLDPSHNITVNLLATFIFDDQLFLITKDWFLYEVPRETLEMSYDQLLMKDAAKKIEDKWPTLNDPIFGGIKDKITMCFSFNNEKNPQVLFLPSNNLLGVLLNIKTGNFIEKFVNKKKETQIIISNLNNDHMWGLRIDADQNQSLQKWIVDYNPDGGVHEFNDTNEQLYLFVDQKRKHIVLYSEPKPAELPKEYQPLKDSFMAGFIWNEKFYLFTSKQIYIFEVALTQILKKTAELKVISTNDYLKCKVSDLASSGMTIGVILAIVLPILFVILLVLLFLRRTGSKKHHHKHKDKEEAKPSEVPSNAPSCRSTGMSSVPQFGKLQAKSARSKTSQSAIPSNIATNRSSFAVPSKAHAAASSASATATNRSGLASSFPNTKQSKLSSRNSTRSIVNSRMPTNRSGM